MNTFIKRFLAASAELAIEQVNIYARETCLDILHFTVDRSSNGCELIVLFKWKVSFECTPAAGVDQETLEMYLSGKFKPAEGVLGEK